MPGNTARRIARAERIERELEYRRAGLSYREISARVGVNHVIVFRDIQHVMDRLNERVTENAEVLRRIESERLDALQYALWETATQGDTKAVQTVLNLMERRAKLWGLDAPSRQEIISDDLQIKVILRANGNG